MQYLYYTMRCYLCCTLRRYLYCTQRHNSLAIYSAHTDDIFIALCGVTSSECFGDICFFGDISTAFPYLMHTAGVIDFKHYGDISVTHCGDVSASDESVMVRRKCTGWLEILVMHNCSIYYTAYLMETLFMLKSPFFSSATGH